MANSSAPVKVDRETHALIAHGATALHMSQKDLLAAAVREYLGARREEINAALRRTMNALDGTDTSRVAMLTGLAAERLDELGGVPESR
jgi:type IV pilus biogenesis protein CpaD/CtpE